jgi:hypothetical protein
VDFCPIQLIDPIRKYNKKVLFKIATTSGLSHNSLKAEGTACSSSETSHCHQDPEANVEIKLFTRTSHQLLVFAPHLREGQSSHLHTVIPMFSSEGSA